MLELTDKWLRQLNGSAEELLNLMRELGYSAWDISRGTPVPIDTAPADQIDVLFVPHGQAPLVAAWKTGAVPEG